MERRLAELTAKDRVVQKLMEHKGVGLVTAVTLRAEIGRFDRFRTGKQLARFCGVTPRNASSGKRQADAGLIKAGNPQLRAVLIETAHRLMRFDPRWMSLGASLRHRTHSGSMAAAAVANRWVRWLFHQMRNDRTGGIESENGAFRGVLDGRLLRVVEGLYGAVRREPRGIVFRENRHTRADEDVLVLRTGLIARPEMGQSSSPRSNPLGLGPPA